MYSRLLEVLLLQAINRKSIDFLPLKTGIQHFNKPAETFPMHWRHYEPMRRGTIILGIPKREVVRARS